MSEKKIKLKVIGVDDSPSEGTSDSSVSKPKIKLNSAKLKSKNNKSAIGGAVVDSPSIQEIPEQDKISQQEQEQNIADEQQLDASPNSEQVNTDSYDEYDIDDGFEDYVDEDIAYDSTSGKSINTAEYKPDSEVTFIGAVKDIYRRIFDFTGRTTKREYLYSLIWFIIVNIVLTTIVSVLILFVPLLSIPVSLFMLATNFGQISLGCRRFKDLGLYWWTGLASTILSILSLVAILVIIAASGGLNEATVLYLINDGILSMLPLLIIGQLALLVESIWQLVLFLTQGPDSYTNKKNIGFVLIIILAIGYICTVIPFTVMMDTTQANTNGYQYITTQNSGSFTFGEKSVGYVTADEPFIFDGVDQGFLTFYNESDTVSVQFTDMVELFGTDGSSITNDVRNSMYETIVDTYANLESAIDSYSVTTKNRINGYVVVLSTDDIEDYDEEFGYDEYYLFITDECKAVVVVGSKSEANSIIDSYTTICNNPDLEPSQKDIENKNMSLSYNYSESIGI